MIVDWAVLQQAIEDFVVEPFDHTFLNKDIAYFEKVVPTAENIAVYIRELLRQPIRELGAKLHEIKLIESPNNSCEIYCSDTEDKQDKIEEREPVLARV